MRGSTIEQMKFGNRPAANRCGLALIIITFALCHYDVLSAQPPRPSLGLKRCWTYPAVNLAEQGMSSDGTRVFLPEDDARVEALSVRDGSRMWFSDLGGEIVSNVLEGNAALYVATGSKNPAGSTLTTAIRSLSKETGITNWVAELPGASRVYLGLGGAVLTAVSDKGKIVAFDAASGARRWDFLLGGNVTAAPYFANGSLIIAIDLPGVVVLSVAAGNVVYKRGVQYRPTAVYLVNGQTGAWGDERGNVTVFDIGSDKTIWKLKHGAAISDISFVGETLLVTSDDDFVYAVAASNGNVRWKKRQPERIFKPSIMTGDVVVLSAKNEGTTTVLEGNRGRLIDQIKLSAGSNLLQFPIAFGDTVLMAATTGLSAYSLSGCIAK